MQVDQPGGSCSSLGVRWREPGPEAVSLSGSGGDVLIFESISLPSASSFLPPRFQGWSRPIKMLNMDRALTLCSRTRHHRPKTSTIRWRARWASLIGRLHMIPLRGEIDYPIITLPLSLVPLRLLHRHQKETNPTTATQSKTQDNEGVLH